MDGSDENCSADEVDDSNTVIKALHSRESHVIVQYFPYTKHHYCRKGKKSFMDAELSSIVFLGKWKILYTVTMLEFLE